MQNVPNDFKDSLHQFQRFSKPNCVGVSVVVGLKDLRGVTYELH